MILQKNIAIIGLFSTSLVLGAVCQAEASYLRTPTDFYNYYDQDFSLAQSNIIEQVFDSSASFLESNGKQNLIDAGFLPFLFPLKGHGEHWFLPSSIGTLPDVSMPTGYNVDQNDQVVGAFFTAPKYSLPKLLEFAQQINPSNFEIQALTHNYQSYKDNQVLPKPSIFNDFGVEASWHSHENTVFNNLGSYDPQSIEFTQSLSDENFVTALVSALSDNSIVAAPYEQDNLVGYPGFNSLIAPGFYMIHFWFGLGNDAGLFANTHSDVSPDAIEEHLTFEDGVSDHNHDHDSHRLISEPSFPTSLLIFGLGGITAVFGCKNNKITPIIKSNQRLT